MVKKSVVEAPIPEVLPITGSSRWSGFKRFMPISLGTWLTLVKQGRAPQPQKLGSRATFWKNSEIHEWLLDPANYSAGGQKP